MQKGNPTSIRLPIDLQKKLEEMAEKEHRTFSQAIEVAIRRYMRMKDDAAVREAIRDEIY